MKLYTILVLALTTILLAKLVMTSVEDSFPELCLKKGEILTFFVSGLL